MERKTVFLTISIALNMLFVIGFFIGKRMYYSHQGYLNSHPNGGNDSLITYTFNRYKANENLISLFKSLPHDSTDIVFLGTSLTQGFPLQEMFKNCRLKNRGIGGNTSIEILNRLNEAITGHPSKLFIEAGVNDIGKYQTIDTPLQNIEQIALQTIKSSPRTRIFINSILPTSAASQRLKIIEINKHLKTFALSHNAHYIDLYKAFAVDSIMNKNLTVDGVHLNASGYKVWANNIRPLLN